LKTYKAHVRVNGILIEVMIQAKNYHDAQRTLEGQYGKGSIAIYPQEVSG
jgi:hypothetical protein